MMIVGLFATFLLGAVRILGEPIVRRFVPDHVDQIMRLVTIALIVAVAFVVDGLLRRFYWQRHLNRKRRRETPRLVQDIVSIFVVAIGVAIGLWWQEGLTLTGIAATSVAVAAGLGIALQPDIQDVFSGLAINYEDTCSIGDWVTVHSQDLKDPVYGRVSGLSWRSTFLTREDGCRVSIPNHLFTSNPVVNHSRPPGAKRLSLEIRIDPRMHSERVLNMLLGETFKSVRKPGLARNPDPDALVTAINPDSVVYAIRFWHFPDELTPGSAKSVVLQALQDVLSQNRVPMPVTQIELVKAPDLESALGEREIHDGLCHANLFRNALNQEQRDLLASRCKPIELSAGAVLMRQGDPAAAMYIVLEGAVSVSIGSDTTSIQEVAVSATGDVVGEMSLMTGAPRTATVTALTRLRVLEITKEAIEGLLKSAPELFERFSRILAQRRLENETMANRRLNVHAVEGDILSKMRDFFSRAFR